MKKFEKDSYKKKASFRIEQLLGQIEYKKKKEDLTEEDIAALTQYEDGVTAAYMMMMKVLEEEYE